jgi:hypothetical protein
LERESRLEDIFVDTYVNRESIFSAKAEYVEGGADLVGFSLTGGVMT